MILVDIYVPSLDKTFDFQLDETIAIQSVADEIGEMLGKQVKTEFDSKKDKFLLCSYEYRKVLPQNETLAGCGIRNGSRLLLL